MQVRHRWHVTASVALAGAGVIAVTPVAVPPPGAHGSDIALTAGEEQITLDLVRSAQDARSEPIIHPVIPGPELTDTGQEQAQDLADTLAQQGSYAGVYAGQQIRMEQTATPLADLLDKDVQILPGLNAMDAGIYLGVPIDSPGGHLFALTSAAWILGLEFLPVPGSGDLNGMAFEERFNDAVQTIYDSTVSGGGPTTDVAVSAEQAITVWTMMNVDNPDFATLVPLFLDAVRRGDLESVLPPAGTVVVRGDPEDGWTLVSFNGHPIPQDPGLLTELFVDFRDLIDAPQTAAWNISQAALTGDATTIMNAVAEGLHNVITEIVQFPGSVFNDVAGAVSNLGTDTAGQAAAETATTLSDALGTN